MAHVIQRRYLRFSGVRYHRNGVRYESEWVSGLNRNRCPISIGIRIQGSGFRVQGSGFRVQGSGFRVQGSGNFANVKQGNTSEFHWFCETRAARNQRRRARSEAGTGARFLARNPLRWVRGWPQNSTVRRASPPGRCARGAGWRTRRPRPGGGPGLLTAGQAGHAVEQAGNQKKPQRCGFFAIGV